MSQFLSWLGVIWKSNRKNSGELHHQDSEVGDPSLPQQRSTIRQVIQEQKQLWESSGIHLTNFSNRVEQKTWEELLKKGRKNHFILPASSHPAGPRCSMPDGPTQLERALTGKGGAGEQPASPAFQGSRGRTHFSFTPPRDRHRWDV